jgi:hypothetical protein
LLNNGFGEDWTLILTINIRVDAGVETLRVTEMSSVILRRAVAVL